MKRNNKNGSYWIQKTHLLKADEYICSSCGHSFKQPFDNCPFCGSRNSKSRYDPSWVDEAEMLDLFFGD